MPLLDLFERDHAVTLDDAHRRLAPNLPAEFSEAYEAALDHGLLFGASISRANARMQAAQDHVDDIYRKTGTRLPAPNEQTPFGGKSSLDEYNEKITGLSAQFPSLNLAPLTAADLDAMAERRAREARTAYERMQEREKTWGGLAGSLTGAGEAALRDPVNILTLPLGAAAGTGIVGTALIEAGVAGGSQFAIEVAAAPFQEEIKPGFGEEGEKGQNILEAAGFGGVLGGGIKTLGAAWRRARTGRWGREVRDAGNVVESEAQVAETNVFPGVEGEIAHRTALQHSIDDMIAGRPVEAQVEAPSLLAGYEQRLAPVMEARARAATSGERAVALELEAARLPATMERLSEVQLGEYRTAARRIAADTADTEARLAREAEAITGERAAIGERRTAAETQRGEIERLKGELATVQQRADAIAPKADPATEARLAAVEQELSGTIGPDRRALLETERDSIRANLKGDPALNRERASLAQEIKGRTREVARLERALSKALAQSERQEKALVGRETKTRVTRELTGERSASRTETNATELRKSIETLARDGYGVRLAREEAQGMAERVLQADDGVVDDVLRGVTDTLVRRGQEARAGRGERTIAGQRQERQTEYWTDQMRKRIQGLAREVGYDMPPAEAATLATRLRGLPEDEALHLLDEIMLRPRTVAELLPGMRSTIEMPAAARVPKPQEPSKPATNIPENIPADSKIAALRPLDIDKLRADPKTRDAVIVELDRLRAAGVGPPREIGSDTLRKQFGGPGPHDFDQAAADRFLRGEVSAALAAGDRVTLSIEGKQVRIVEVSNLGLKDENGNPWGILGIVMQKPGERSVIEIRPKARELQVPTEGPDGALVMRNVEEMVDELDIELAAARDLRACASPQTEAAE